MLETMVKEFNVMDIPDAKSGNWEIRTFEVKDDTDKFIFNFRAGSRRIRSGIYKGIYRGGHVIMSNTPAELNDHYEYELKVGQKDCKTVLINGLGLGCALSMALKNPYIEKITVVEISQDVINLVSPYINDSRVQIICEDAYLYKPTENYDVVWHDIWDDICSDNLEGMAKLHRKYGRKTKWQSSWCKSERQYKKRQEKKRK